VLIDCEVLYFLLHQQWPSHRFFHSVLGGLVAAAIASPVLILYGRRLLRANRKPRPLLVSEFAPVAVVVGAATGAVSHSLLDDIMHSDVVLGPPLNSHDLYGLLGVGTLHLMCVMAGLVGVAWGWVRHIWSAR